MARSRIYYKPDHKSFGEFMLSGQIADPVEKVAKEIADLARGASERSNGPGPHMADRWDSGRNGDRVIVTEGFANPRVRVDVFNPDIAAAAQEFGYKGHRKNNTLREIAARFGDYSPGPQEN